MQLSTLTKCLIFAPVAAGLAQTPKPAAPKPAPPPAIVLEDVPGADPIVITVGDEKITKSEFERLLAGLPAQARSQAQTPAGKRKIGEQVAELKSLAQEARKRGVDRTPETRELIKFQTDSVLANVLARELSSAVKPDEAVARAYFDKHKSEYGDLVTASHILIRFKGSQVPVRPGEKDLTEEEALAKAQELRKRIVAGEDFAKVAMADSDDTTTAKVGGSLGEPFTRQRMVPAFADAAFKLPVGEVSEPIKTAFGYHLIKVTKHAPATFEEEKAGIEQRLKPELAQQAVESIRKQTPVTMNESYFGKEPAASK